MTLPGRDRLVRLLLPRLPRLLVATPLVLALLVATIWLQDGTEAATWRLVAMGFSECNAEYDAPGRECEVAARARQNRLEEASPLDLVSGRRPPPGESELIDRCIQEAIEIEAALNSGR